MQTLDDLLGDPEYARWLDQCSDDCLCCSRCWEHPCPGVLAGGVCDMIPCRCEAQDDDTSAEDDFQHDDDHVC